ASEEEVISMIRVPFVRVRSGLRRAPPAEGQARDDVYTEHEHEEHEGGRPRLAVPVLVGRDRIREDHDGEGGRRLQPAGAPEAVAERREEERRRLAGDPREGEEEPR